MSGPARIARRTRIVVLGSIAVLCAAGAASLVSAHESRIRSQVGPLVPVLVAAQPIHRDRQVTEANAAGLFAERRVPSRFVPPGALRSPAQAVGYRSQGDLAPGDYVTAGSMVAPGDPGRRSALSKAGGRPVEVAVSGGASVLSQLEPGSFVDVLVTSERGGGARTFLALQRVELLEAHAAGDGGTGGGERPADALATLRVSLRQAIMLTAAQNFAREIRLIPRPVGDRSVFPSTVVAASDLRP